ncbi:Bardet-Biedl syndrome 10 protein homolog [Polyodon spathula]|uniref:Bardet-Biedl syndrome 10 protein homolog n=1 Tax=Polyodon spathula TaxID=7913 RepID=UPI001B7EBD51|nr:Bardet-Biedl syndrome 10 protein homolog [Polyodon spathula]
MNHVHSLDIDTLIQIAETLESIVCQCFGPNGGQVLFTKATGELLVTRDGKRVLNSLLLDHPIARMIVDCVSAHCGVTGDGAKSFILLLSALLRGLQASVDKGTAGQSTCHNFLGRAKQRSEEMKHVTDCLLTFQTQVLNQIIRQHLNQHVTSLFTGDQMTVTNDKIGSIMEAYFCGKIGNVHCKFLSEMACDFFFKCTCDRGRGQTLNLICRHFLDLHTAVKGFPIGSSRVLEGLVLHRDFTVYCQTDGQLKVLVVTEPIQPPLSDAGTTLLLRSNFQLQSSNIWIAKRVEEIMNFLQQNQVKLLLSSVKQSDVVLYHAQLCGISVVQCIEADELSLFCYLAGIAPLSSPWDILHSRDTDLANAVFCKPVLLGAHRYAHIGLMNRGDFSPHCVILCGPIPGLTEQCVSAFHGGLKMLQHAFEPVDLCQGQGLCSRNSNNANANEAHQVLTHCSLKTIVQEDSIKDTINETSDRHDICCPTTEEICASSNLVSDKEQRGVIREDPKANQSSLAADVNLDIRNAQTGILAGCKTTGDNLDEHLKQRNINCVNKAREMGSVFGQHSCAFSSCAIQKESTAAKNTQRDIRGSALTQEHADVLIEAGSVLPVGGSFEFLLHHYLRLYAQHSLQPEVKTTCSLVADAVLNIPRNIYNTKSTNRHFLQVYTKVRNDIQSKGCISDGPGLLESVSCKYQLLVSVLQCARSLVTIDSLIGIDRKTQNTTKGEKEDVE